MMIAHARDIFILTTEQYDTQLIGFITFIVIGCLIHKHFSEKCSGQNNIMIKLDV